MSKDNNRVGGFLSHWGSQILKNEWLHPTQGSHPPARHIAWCVSAPQHCGKVFFLSAKHGMLPYKAYKDYYGLLPIGSMYDIYMLT